MQLVLWVCVTVVLKMQLLSWVVMSATVVCKKCREHFCQNVCKCNYCRELSVCRIADVFWCRPLSWCVRSKYNKSNRITTTDLQSKIGTVENTTSAVRLIDVTWSTDLKLQCGLRVTANVWWVMFVSHCRVDRVVLHRRCVMAWVVELWLRDCMLIGCRSWLQS